MISCEGDSFHFFRDSLESNIGMNKREEKKSGVCKFTFLFLEFTGMQKGQVQVQEISHLHVSEEPHMNALHCVLIVLAASIGCGEHCASQPVVGSSRCSTNTEKVSKQQKKTKRQSKKIISGCGHGTGRKRRGRRRKRA